MTNLTINPANLVSGVTVKSMLHEQYYGTKSKGQVVTLRTLNIRIKQNAAVATCVGNGCSPGCRW